MFFWKKKMYGKNTVLYEIKKCKKKNNFRKKSKISTKVKKLKSGIIAK